MNSIDAVAFNYRSWSTRNYLPSLVDKAFILMAPEIAAGTTSSSAQAMPPAMSDEEKPASAASTHEGDEVSEFVRSSSGSPSTSISSSTSSTSSTAKKMPEPRTVNSIFTALEAMQAHKMIKSKAEYEEFACE